jgi:hypothetical protein
MEQHDEYDDDEIAVLHDIVATVVSTSENCNDDNDDVVVDCYAGLY